MRVDIDPTWWTSGTWQGRPLRQCVEARDVTTIFRFLHARGVSFTTIGGLVGISPNRASEIAKRVHQVSAYDVLERIAIGLQIPRALMGLGREPQQSTPTEVRRTGRELCSELAVLRSELDQALAAATVSTQQLEMIEESTHEYVQAYPCAAPAEMLGRVAVECTEVLALSRRRQPAAVQARLSGTAAVLATLCADALMRLGETSDARLWYRTAALAADDSLEPRLGVLVRAQATMLPYYFGNPRQTVVLADKALAASERPCSSTALAAAARARALARMGAAQAAVQAMKQAQEAFDAIGTIDSDAAFDFPAKRLLFYLSGAATWLGDDATAFRLQDEALELYRASAGTSIDPALILIDRSICLVREHRADEAASVARQAMANLSQAQRTEIVLTRAQDVVKSVPTAERRGTVVQLDDYIRECRRQTRTLARGNTELEP